MINPDLIFQLNGFREGTFFIVGEGEDGPGPGRGGSSVKFLENGESQTFLSRSPGEGHIFFITTKSLLHATSIKSTERLKDCEIIFTFLSARPNHHRHKPSLRIYSTDLNSF